MFEPFTFTPAYQPKPEAPVTFQLRPLNLASLHDHFQRHYNRNHEPGWADHSAVFVQNVIGWTGRSEDCTPKVRAQLASGDDLDWYIWIGQISGELYTRALLKDNERKNS
jgi:hypothetical protein